MEAHQLPLPSQRLDATASTACVAAPIYAPLDIDRNELRLLEILPARPSHHESQIECRLFTCSLDDKPSYAALSYVWGDPKQTKAIIVNDHEVQAAVNLVDALYQLRKDKVQILWADALCIHQADDIEKSHQVKNMTQIYREATTVIAWLGPEDQTTERAVQTIEKLSHIAKAVHLDTAAIVSYEAFASSETTESATESGTQVLEFVGKDPTFAKGDFGLIVSLFEKTYWKRLWVIQELAVASKATLCCGNCNVPWDDVQAATASLVLSWAASFATSQHNRLPLVKDLYEPFIPEDSVVHLPPAMSASALLQTTGGKSLSLLDLLDKTCDGTDLIASNPRDRIYALHGLIARAEQDMIVVDYSLSTADLFIQTTIKMLARYGPQILVFAGRSRKTIPDLLPDWSIDWTCTQRLTDGPSTGKDRNPATPYQFRILGNNRIALQAATVDRVSEVVEYTGGPDTMPRIISRLIHLSSRKQEARRNGKPSEAMRMLWYTLFRGARTGSASADEIDEIFSDYVEQLVSLDNVPQDQDTFQVDRRPEDRLLESSEHSPSGKNRSTIRTDEPHKFEHYIEEEIPDDSVFFVTEQGYIGSCSVSVQAGDVLYAFPEHCQPFILRPESGGPKEAKEIEWDFVGPAFVGELSDVDENGRSHLDEFWATNPAMEEIILC